MIVDEWVDWMLSRPRRKARQRRFFDSLDVAMPDREKSIVSPGFSIWTNWVNPQTGKTRLNILCDLSLENFDGVNTARFLKFSQSSLKVIDNEGSVDPKQLK